MRSMSILRCVMLSVLLLCGMAQAQFPFVPGAPKPSYITLSAESDVEDYRAGEPFLLALKGKITPGWHAYFRNPGTVGEAMTADLQAPEGFRVEGPFWRVPERIEGAVGVSYGYEAPVVVWRVTAEESAPESASFSLTATAQACSDEGCAEPETKTVTLTLTRRGDSAEVSPSSSSNGKIDVGSVEVLGDTPVPVSARQEGDTVRLQFQTPEEVQNAYFFSFDNSISPLAEQTLRRDGETCTLLLTRNDGQDFLYPPAEEESVGKPLARLAGLLTYGEKHMRVDLPLASSSAPTPSGEAPGAAGTDGAVISEGENSAAEPSAVGAAEAGAAAAGKDTAGTTPGGEPAADGASRPLPVSLPPLPEGMSGIILSLFLGGLILNLMPCVFPVIGLKIMSFVELGGGERRRVWMHSLAFVAGILVSFWLLALLLIVLSNLDTLMELPWTQWLAAIGSDAGSATRSWAVWMQNEWVVYGILLLLLILGMSMFGLFEIGVGATGAGQNLQRRGGFSGSFFQGLLVTVVATPCSAPFLGAALPAAMALPGVWMLVALTFMALGLAFPYIVLGLFPSLVSLLPRPGAWMESLKQGLSFLLFAAAAWMLDVYLAFIPDSASASVPWVLMSLVVICAAFWVYGRWCPLYRSRRARLIGWVVALALAALGVWGSMPMSGAGETIPGAAGGQTSGLVVASGAHPMWNTWSPEGMERALAEGRPVFVDFTARWCATCQANKKVAYTPEVCAELERAGVVLMRADKTRPDAAIDAELRRLGRTSVPVNVLYLPDGKEAVTRELLTPGYLLDFLREHLKEEQEA